MAAPVKPEPAAAQEGDAGPELNPIESALRAARERFTAKEPLVPAAGEPEGEPGGDDDAAGAAAGAEGGDEGEGDGEEPAAQEGGEAAQGADEGEPAGEGEPAEGDAPIEGEGGEGEIDADLIVAIPARREGDDDIEIAVEDKATAERLRQLKNSAVRGEQLHAQQARIEKDQADIEEMETWISTDPAGFIMNNVPPEVVEVVAMTLITKPEIWARVQDKLEALSDPSELRLVQAELKAQGLEAEKFLTKQAEGRRHSKQQAKLILSGIDKMVPATDGISDSRRETIIASVQNAVAAAVRDKKLTTIDVKDLPLLASAVLRQHGIDPMAAAAAMAEEGDSESEPGKKPPAKRKQKTAKQLKSDSDKRKKAAASTPPGSGAPAAVPKLPSGQRLEDRIALAREKGIGTLMTGK